MKTPRIDQSGTEAASKAVADAQAAANNLRQNFSADLGTDNIAQVVAGGTADAMGDIGGGVRKRKSGSALSSSLGLE